MANSELHAHVNRLLIDLHRSLLQYVGECWPWTDNKSAEERAIIADLVVRQRRQIEQLADYLRESDWLTDFGSYPTEYTNLHYVALDYLLNQLVESEVALLHQTNQVLAQAQSCPELAQLLGRVHAEEQAMVAELRKLASQSTQASWVQTR
ncbi:hypothetical protein [Thalassoroseus pseudoceratinae]|uniref:hypothetical protein n=1 Tax=Thalassoroseus pseudoceratinae TaxID=2713176 RepID=UPI00141FC2CF|nr:hypothetical protein [Thalassoroseus pseudoceratinae]